MNLKQTQLHILHKKKDLSQTAKTGVSLHCHTEYSKEMLDFVPHYAAKLPIISYFWKKEQAKYLEKEGKGIDFSTAYWSPPLTPNDVYRIEEEQINSVGLDAVVSLSDHDSINGNLTVNETVKNTKAPISLEWTVPFDFGFFHVGVHNLPPENAVEISKELVGFTFSGDEKPNNARLHELFKLLNDNPEILVILNHPIWDIEMVGKEKHEILLKNFIKEFGQWIHAFEINGFRSWSENKAVIEMAEALGFPIVTGGDRHGCQPNTVFNLTNAETFAEFADEIRVGKRSEVALMPEYSQPLHSRQLGSFSEILKQYDHFPEGRQKWFDRVYFDIGDGEGLRQLSVHWKRGGPTWLRWAIWTLGVLGSSKARPVFALARKKHDRVPKDLAQTKFEIPNLEDIAPKTLSSDVVS